MKKAKGIIVATIFILNISICSGQNSSSLYKEISKKEFKKLENTRKVSSFKGIDVYNGVQTSGHIRAKFSYNILLIKKEKKKKYYRLDYKSEFLNDSTIRFYAPPMIVIGNKSIWEEGRWFYADFFSENGRSGVNFNVDTLPEKSSDLIKDCQSKGIYRLKGNELKKVSDDQSEDSFYKIKVDGLYYLPNPGRFYLDVKLNELIN